MIPTFDHNVISSLKEFLDHKVVSKLQAWKNISAPLFLDQDDDRLSGYKKIAMGPKQWLYDSSIVGATIADPAQFTHADWKSAKTDFKNSRFVVPANVTAPAPSSALLAVKHFNSYVSSKDDEELFQNTIFEFEPEMKQQSSAIGADSYHAPCYFIKSSYTDNEGLALGGLDKTIFKIKITCFCKTESELIGLGSVLRDLKNTSMICLTSTPLNEFNDLKTRPWSFTESVTSAVSNGNSVIHVESASFNPISSDNINSKLKNIYVGLANLTIFVTRYPRQ